MSVFRRFCNTARSTAEQVTAKVEELTDAAVLALKIKSLEVKVDEKYEDLGRLVYSELHAEESKEEEKLRLVAEIDALFDRITLLKQEEAAAKTQKEEKEAPADET